MKINQIEQKQVLLGKAKYIIKINQDHNLKETLEILYDPQPNLSAITVIKLYEPKKESMLCCAICIYPFICCLFINLFVL